MTQSVGADAASALADLLRRVQEARLPLETASAPDARALQHSLRNQLEDYLLPRVQNPDAPLLVVIGGSTGAGKSTLVNSILRRSVTESGVIRPTTRSPVLVHHPDDAEHFQSDRVLAGFARVTREETELDKPQLRLVADASVPPGLALLDSPDIDSVMESNRRIARQLLAAADLWLFVTTAARYADAVPWALLTEAQARGTTVALVLDRVPTEANREVRRHLTDLLSDAGLGSSPVFTVPEVPLEDGLLPEAAVFTLTSWILNLGRSDAARSRVVEKTLIGALATVPPRAEELAAHIVEQEDAHARLSSAVDDSFGSATDELASSLADGRVLRGEVLARWQDFVGAGQFFRGLEPTVARLRDRITAAVTGKRDTAEPLELAIEQSVSLLIREQAVQAVTGARMSWEDSPAGAALIAAHGDDGFARFRVPADFDARVNRAITEWSASVNELVRDVGQSKRAKARILSFGVNGVGAVVMLAAFAGTGGLTGAEVGIAGGTAVVAGKLLDTIFGDQVTRDLADTVRTRLLDSAQELLASCRAPFDDALAAAEVPPRQAGTLRGSGTRLEEAL
ncbi:MAG: dynamin family protein [Brevibacterium yomogidense]|uniref:Putative ABC iron siderophore transporter, fused permease and ATPase domains n=1 Tax=Brevibacterium yomogidense TaxID=946573 RepID=A0A1X6XAV1_9MICO|nr:dynamin family protein [Brevibacterium yomogidense]SLM96240.1 Putative ABC iron siderophore transporter, fused permease and ATPase domains [Brevibacterium yomogidense]